MMWLSKIELKNFKSYVYAEFNMPEPKDGKNIVLIGGYNGHGKTTLLEAIYLCLYGDEAPNYLARSGISDHTAYSKFLNQALNIDAKNKKEINQSMTVKCVINLNANRAIEIQRIWHFKNGIFNDSEAIYTEILRKDRKTPKTDGVDGFKISPIIDQYFIPVRNAPFFIFDGEQIKLMADRERNLQITNGLDDLVGVRMLREVKADLLSYITDKKKNLVVKDMTEQQFKINSYEREINELNQEYRSIDSELEAINYDIKRTNEAYENTFKQFQRYGSASANQDFSLHNERNSLTQKDNEMTNELKTVLSSQFPFVFASHDHLTKIRQALLNDQEFSKLSSSNNTIIETKNKFTLQFLSDEKYTIDPKLTSSQEKTLQAKIEHAWIHVLSQNEVNVLPSILFSVFSDQNRFDILNKLNSVGIDSNRIKELSRNKETIKNQINDIDKRLRRSEEQSNDANYKVLSASLSELRQKLDDLRFNLTTKENRIKSIKGELDNKKSEYSREIGKLGKDDHNRPLIQKAEDSIKAIDEICRRLFDTKINELSSALTKHLNFLMHKKQFIGEVVISGDGSLTIHDRNGEEIEFERSAGENQIFATALLAALSEVSGKQAPLIVDTPLGRLDSMHRENLFEFWTKDDNRQVILMVQNTEIDKETFKDYYDKISTTYLLQHEDQSGGGVTKALENRFFYGR